MSKRLARHSLLFFVMLLLSGACSAAPIARFDTPSALNPGGSDAARIADLWWLMLGLGAAVWVLVNLLLIAAFLRRRRATSDTAPDSSGGDTGRKWLIRGGIALPLVVVAVVFGYSLYTLAMAENPGDKPAVKIEVVGRRWWWEVKYPDQEFETANEIHIPAGAPVQLTLRSADVIHSFWVPQLSGKMDLVPGEINHLTLQADHTGVFHGQCAEFCGLQHGHMGFLVVAESQADFDSWLAAQQQKAVAPTDQAALQGQQVFLATGCAFCHPVNGLNDKSVDRSIVDLGPDLTHIQSRLMLAGASLDNNRGNLAGWIVDAQHFKPGSLMPNMRVEGADLQALLAYLGGLK